MPELAPLPVPDSYLEVITTGTDQISRGIEVKAVDTTCPSKSKENDMYN